MNMQPGDLVIVVKGLWPNMGRIVLGRLAVHISVAEQWLHLPVTVNDQASALQLKKQDLTVRPLPAYYLHREDLRGSVIGYGGAPLTSIAQNGPTAARAVLQGLGRA